MAETAIDRRDMARLDDAILAVSRTARNGLEGTIKQATIFAVQSAAKVTPIARNRKLVNVSRWGRKKRIANDVPWWARYQVQVWKNEKPRDVYANDKAAAEKLKVPRFKGAAKMGWWATVRQWGKKPPAAGSKLGRIAGRVAYLVQTREKGTLVAAQAVNRVKYISRIAPDSGRIGLVKATNRIEAIYIKRVDRELERAFKRGAVTLSRSLI